MANSLVRSFGNGDARSHKEDEGFGLWREIDRVFDNLARSFGRDNDAPTHRGFARDVLAPEHAMPEIPLGSSHQQQQPLPQMPALRAPEKSLASEEASRHMQAKSEPIASQPTPIRLNRTAAAAPGTLNPVADAYEDEDNFELVVELPGCKPEDIDIEFAEGGLNISAERRRVSEGADEKKHHVRERSFGTFKRRFPIPFQANPDIIQAAFQDGLVIVTVPRPPETKPRIKKIGLKKA